MASTSQFLFAATVSLLLFFNVSGRELAVVSGDITGRLNGGGGGLMECWNALYELKSCTSEIVSFFLTGETKIGSECCQAVHVITTNCWPAMLTSLGFTADEANMLRGYCMNPDSPAPSPVNI